jgi:hypothetical protein
MAGGAKMRDAMYRVQFVDHEGETAFTNASNREGAIKRACGMRPALIVQAIVDDRTGDIVMDADEIWEAARRRSRRDQPVRHVVLSRNHAASVLAALKRRHAARR